MQKQHSCRLIRHVERGLMLKPHEKLGSLQVTGNYAGFAIRHAVALADCDDFRPGEPVL